MASEDAAAALTERVDNPIYVVCARHGEQMAGCVAGYVTECSINPVRFLVCISKANYTYGVARHSAGLSLHLLGSEQHDLAVLFGHLTGDTSDKFSQCEWATGETGAPLLRRCAAWTEGPVLDKHDVGDHVAFLVAPIDGGAGPEEGQLTVKQISDITAGHPD
jgi:flavin reductase (DIM6/NTAB) family NADH-FMN oxidoreductase RutF